MSWARWSFVVMLVACESRPTAAPTGAPDAADAADALDCSEFCRCWRNCSPYDQADPCPQCKKAGCLSARCALAE